MNRRRVVYISGPMTGLPDCNRPAFHRAAAELSAAGHAVLNPACLPDGLEYEQYMAIDLAMVAQACTVALLPGWELSEGAAREIVLASLRGAEIFEI